MRIRLLIATPTESCRKLLDAMLEAALCLIPLDVTAQTVHSRTELLDRLAEDIDDVVMLDWDLTEDGTPRLVHDILAANNRMRIVALLPLHLRQYRQSVWEAGACSSVPKENMDQEWLSSLLCVMRRAMEREARILGRLRDADTPISQSPNLPIS